MIVRIVWIGKNTRSRQCPILSSRMILGLISNRSKTLNIAATCVKFSASSGWSRRCLTQNLQAYTTILETVAAWHKISNHVDAILQIVKKFESTPNQSVSFDSLIKSDSRHKLCPEPGSEKYLANRFVNIRSWDLCKPGTETSWSKCCLQSGPNCIK